MTWKRRGGGNEYRSFRRSDLKSGNRTRAGPVPPVVLQPERVADVFVSGGLLREKRAGPLELPGDSLGAEAGARGGVRDLCGRIGALLRDDFAKDLVIDGGAAVVDFDDR